METTGNIAAEDLKGAHKKAEHSVVAKDREAALDKFKNAHKRMLNVNIWHKLGGMASADFELTSGTDEKERLAQIGDFFRIDIPGPGPISGGGYDWVKVEAIEDNSNPSGESENYSMTVRPCSNPNKSGDDIAHFFTADATSTFVIRRDGNTITAAIYGGNEVANTDTGNIIDKARNATVAAAAVAGIAKLEWGSMVKGFLADGIPD